MWTGGCGGHLNFHRFWQTLNRTGTLCFGPILKLKHGLVPNQIHFLALPTLYQGVGMVLPYRLLSFGLFSLILVFQHAQCQTCEADHNRLLQRKKPEGKAMTLDDAIQQARELASQMNFTEKFQIVRGIGWDKNLFVGNTIGVKRLDVPSLNLQDSGQGYRTTQKSLIGKVTAYPSALAVAATWDQQLTFTWGQALGQGQQCPFRAGSQRASGGHKRPQRGVLARRIGVPRPAAGAGVRPRSA